MGKLLVRWFNGGLCQITKTRINLELIKIIQFCLKIYDLWRHPYLLVGVWVVGWIGRLMAGVMSNHKYLINL